MRSLHGSLGPFNATVFTMKQEELTIAGVILLAFILSAGMHITVFHLKPGTRDSHGGQETHAVPLHEDGHSGH